MGEKFESKHYFSTRCEKRKLIGNVDRSKPTVAKKIISGVRS